MLCYVKYRRRLLRDAKKSNISVYDTALFSRPQESIYSVEQAEQVIGGMQLSDTGSDSDWLDRVIKDVTVDKASSDNAILYKVRVNNTKIEALYDMGASISVMSLWFFNKLDNKPELLPCIRSIWGAGGGILIPVWECFISVQIGNKMSRDQIIVIENLKRDYILGQVLHRENKFGTGYSTNGRHYITLNGELLPQSCLQITTNPVLKTGKIKGQIR